MNRQLNGKDSRAGLWTGRRAVGIGALLAAAALLLAGYRFFGHAILADGEPPKKDSAKTAEKTEEFVQLEESQLAHVTTGPVTERTFCRTEHTTGRIAFNETAMTPVFSPYSGRVVKLYADLGDKVEKDKVLIELDCPELVQAQSDLLAALPAVPKSEATIRLAQRNGQLAEGNLELAKGAAELAVKNETRQKELFECKGASELNWEQAKQATQAAQQAVHQAEQAIEQARSDLQGAQSDLKVAQMTVQTARQKLKLFYRSDEEIRKLEDDRLIDRILRIPAPATGTVTSRKVVLGQYIRSDNTDPLLTITDISTMWMLADVVESNACCIKIGQPVEVKILACPTDLFKATVAYISPAIDPATRRLPVRCVVQNLDCKLKAEMFADFQIATSAPATYPAVPLDAVIQEGLKKIVWVPVGTNRFAKREVVTGLVLDGHVQIVSGVKAGETVVTRGGIYLGGG